MRIVLLIIRISIICGIANGCTSTNQNSESYTIESAHNLLEQNGVKLKEEKINYLLRLTEVRDQIGYLVTMTNEELYVYIFDNEEKRIAGKRKIALQKGLLAKFYPTYYFEKGNMLIVYLENNESKEIEKLIDKSFK